jgi:anti-anti-sigma regulatory factor
VILCDAAELTGPDLDTVDALARLQLSARRRGCRVELRNVPPDLAELLELCGLAQVLRLADALGVDPRRQPEHREEAGGVQEEGDPRDPVT